jgi:hypothetical protein
MKSYLSALIIGLSMLIVSPIFSNIVLTGNKPAQAPERVVNDYELSGIEVQYTFNGFNKTEKSEQSKVYQELHIPEFGHLAEVGKPALPAYIDYIAIPDGAEYTLEVSTSNVYSYNDFLIYPALQPARDTEGAPEPEFEIDAEFYKKNIVYPSSPVEIIEIIKIRGLRMAKVRIQPIQYNPHKKELIYNKTVSYKLNFTGGNHFLNPEEHSAYYLSLIQRYPLNSATLQLESKSYSKNSAPNSNLNYIIITHDNYLAAADSLALWKTQMGYNVEVVSAPSWTTADVKSAIHSRYQNTVPHPDYFVIIGDHGDVPAEMKVNSQGDNFGTDLYYACMDGGSDYTADIARGRISVNSATQAMDVVMKIINYERHPIQDSVFYANGVNCAQFQDDDLDGFADRRFTHTSEDVRNYMISQGYDVRRIYQTDANVLPTNYNASYYSNGQALPTGLLKTNGYAWNGNVGHIRSAIDSGKFYLLHRDHGYAGGTGWAHPQFLTGNINQLNNGNKLPVIFSINCHTGEFTLNNCFAENFLRQSTGGAVGVFAASYYSYSGYNDGLVGGFFDGIWSNPGFIPSFGSGGNNQINVQAHGDIVTMGDVLNHGLIRVTQTWGGSNGANRYTNELFHYFGDPAMRIWTEQPDSITASHAANIQCTDTAILISNINHNDVLATLSHGTTVLGKAIISNGSGYIPINMILGSNMKLTLTKRNCAPYESAIGMISGGSLAMSKTIEHNACYGDSLAKISVYPSCGYPPYQISWSTGDTVPTLQNLAAGLYVVTILDNNNTSIVDSITVNQPTSGVSLTSVVTDAKCNFESSGSIDLNVTGGTTPYSYQWSSGHNGPNPSNMSANNYTVTITDADGCEYTESFVVSEPDALVITVTGTSDTNGLCVGTATANVTGGVTPYAYTWNDVNAQTTPTATGLCGGSLAKVTIVDSNNCTRYRSTIIGSYSDVSIQNNDDEVQAKVFPNPSANGTFNIQLEKAFDSESIVEIYDAQGKLIQREVIKQGETEFTIDLSGNATGMYHLRLTCLDQKIRFHKELIIE